MGLAVVGSIADNTLQPEEFRRMFRAGTPAGTLNSGDFQVTQNGTPNMSVNVAAGEASVPGTESVAQGNYYVRNDATVNLTVSAASGTNPRKDIVVVRVRDDDYSGATNSAALEVIAGTPAASPSAPSPPSNSLVLAEITVGQSASTVTSSNISNAGRFRSTNLEHKFLVNDTGNTGILGTINVFDGTVPMPEGWIEYDVNIHGRFTYETKLAAGDQARFTTLQQAPSGTTRVEGRVSMIGEGATISVFATDVIDTIVTGLTANLTFRYQSTSTRNGGTVERRLVIATMNRVR